MEAWLNHGESCVFTTHDLESGVQAAQRRFKLLAGRMKVRRGRGRRLVPHKLLRHCQIPGCTPEIVCGRRDRTGAIRDSLRPSCHYPGRGVA